MNDREYAIHEAGHLIIGVHLGLIGQVICISAKSNQWQAWYTRSSKEVTAKRALAGILSHIRLAPDTIPEPLLTALKESVISDNDHCLERLALPADSFFPLGASHDLIEAKRIAADSLGSCGSVTVTQRLREWEKEVRQMVDDFASQIEDLAKDIRDNLPVLGTSQPYDLDSREAQRIFNEIPLRDGYKKQFQ